MVNIEQLLPPVEEEASAAWNILFLNTEEVRSLLVNHKDKIIQLLARGQSIQGLQWTTTAAAVRVEALTGLAMVYNTLTKYLESFLYSLALAAQVHPGDVNLDDKRSAVAFVLARTWTGTTRTAEPGVSPATASPEKEKETHFAWEPPKPELPEDLAAMMTHINDNFLRMEPKQVLEQLPLWSDLKHVADNNNYRDDKAQREDKVLRGVQQKLLGLMRIYHVLHTYVMDDDLQVLSQQFWGLLCQFEKTVMEQRKQSSIPGSLPVENPLFTAEDLKVAKAREAVNRTTSMFACAEHSSILCLCHTTAFRGYKFKPKGGKGFGKPSGYTKYYPSSS